MEAQYTQNEGVKNYHGLIKQMNTPDIFSKPKSGSGELMSVTTDK